MFIFCKRDNSIVNAEKIGSITIEYTNIIAYPEIAHYHSVKGVCLAQYDDSNIAEKVLIQIFEAMKNGDRVFEMPE